MGWVINELELARLAACLLELGDLAVLALDLVVVVCDSIDIIGFWALSILDLGVRRKASCSLRAFSALEAFLRLLISHAVLVNRDGRVWSEAARESAETLSLSLEGGMHIVNVGLLLLVHAHVDSVGAVSFSAKARHRPSRLRNDVPLVASKLILKAKLTLFKGLANAL